MFIGKTGAFYYRLEGIRVDSFMIGNSYAMGSIRHTNVLTLRYILRVQFCKLNP